ncbi:signal recognition particle protein [Symbiobacterium thermophilum]|uniref:Signal recognition particle protein n=1 Tax=Symbiobacterium thermophilum (strain DSM 24528 / JCM 14929 / IAM 14863 / T) TaxID=292459 RepID=Q67PE3_SYMTH|nr:signal recognition particle protein [Symbiobacterium thermophilum]BAD40450.1 signal recognition particle [Symbiobacterium thermophilum IAM 14863]
MFESLQERLQEAFKRLRGKGKLTESDVNEALREVRLALLEADVNFKVVKSFIARVKERAVGQEILESLNPAQMVIKIVYEELVALMGGESVGLNMADRPPTIIMLCGLQGAGKTTHAAKLALKLKKEGKKPLLVAADVYRPAAIKQLEVLGEQVGVPVYSEGDQASPVDIAQHAVAYAAEERRDVIIVDTAGRLTIDEELMEELQQIKARIQPHDTLLVLDAMIGQDAVTTAEHFHTKLGIDGVILTKLDGDTRGGAALSVREVTGRPIKFVGVGEKLDALEPFYPDRLASRILGMGDVLTLIEKAQEQVDRKQAEEMARKMLKAQFDFEDFLEQLRALQRMGPLQDILKMLPGVGAQLKDINIDEKELKHIEAIILSMTPKERRNPDIINVRRRERIARGSGRPIAEVHRLIKQFEQTRKLMKQLGGMEKMLKRGGKLPRLPGGGFGGLFGRR